jgi:Fe-S cluster assembly scaffold protein SufB
MNHLKNIGLFLLKSISFTIIFWCLWSYLIRPITTPKQNTNNTSSSQEARTEALMNIYEKQAKQAAQQLDIADEQQQRMEKVISSQEEQALRYNQILEKWEKQSSDKK